MMVPEPTDEHRFLLKLVGHWRIEGEAMMGPDKPPETMTGTEHVRALGKLWTLGEGNMGQMPDGSDAVTLMTLGYDPAKGRFVGTFIGSMMANIWPYHGVIDESGRRLPLYSEGPKFDGPGVGQYRDTIKLVDPDTWLFSSELLADDGQWVEFMVGTHVRAKCNA